MDRFTSMQVFAEVVAAGSFTRAATRLDLSTTAVSRHVAELERHLGIRLLHRNTRNLSLTDDGRLFHERAVGILHDLKEAEHEANQSGAEAVGTLRIGMPLSFGLRHVVPLLAEFMRRHPQVQTELHCSDGYADLIEDRLDLALRISPHLEGDLVFRRLAPVHLLVCASPDYLQRHGTPERAEDLSDHICLHYTHAPFDGRWCFLTNGQERLIPIRGPLRADNGDALVNLAEQGLGIVLQPDFLVADGLRRGTLQRILAHERLMDYTLFAIYSHRRHLPRRVRAFVDYAVESYGGTPPWAIVP